MLDLYIAGVVKKGWAEVLASATKFERVFQRFGFEQSDLIRWRAALPATLDVGVSFKLDQPTFPQVAVLLQSSPSKHGFMGSTGGEYLVDDEDEDGPVMISAESMVDDLATLYCFCSNPELLRVMYAVIEAVMLGTETRMLRAWETFGFAGGGDLEAERNLLPAELGIFVRTLRYSGTRVVTGAGGDTDEEFDNVETTVAASDIALDGYNGGVTPGEDEES